MPREGLGTFLLKEHFLSVLWSFLATGTCGAVLGGPLWVQGPLRVHRVRGYRESQQQGGKIQWAGTVLDEEASVPEACKQEPGACKQEPGACRWRC